MDRKVDMTLFSANNWINYQLASQKAAMLGLRQDISETKKAYNIQDKQGPSDRFEAFTLVGNWRRLYGANIKSTLPEM